MAKFSNAPAAAGHSSNTGNEIVVFSIIRESACTECGAELCKGSLLRVEGERPLCLTCADLDHLVFLPRGDTALTRRASKHSTLRAVVVRFSRARKRYERQGILVEEAALERAEQECLADAAARERARGRAAQHRDESDTLYIKEFAKRLGELFPRCPAPERQAIADHACQKHSGRVGRSAAAQSFDPKAIELAVRAHVRHGHTNYDQLLAGGMDRMEARTSVRDAVEEVILRWRTAVDCA
ncbi:MAG: DUF2293 domain-containing protein [Rhizobiales bacterium]|nr:DUF2293 domain-containing protein [Hyphomicrobiales bacterium]